MRESTRQDRARNRMAPCGFRGTAYRGNWATGRARRPEVRIPATQWRSWSKSVMLSGAYCATRTAQRDRLPPRPGGVGLVGCAGAAPRSHRGARQRAGHIGRAQEKVFRHFSADDNPSRRARRGSSSSSGKPISRAPHRASLRGRHGRVTVSPFAPPIRRRRRQRLRGRAWINRTIPSSSASGSAKVAGSFARATALDATVAALAGEAGFDRAISP